jgi:hypothetical protein
VPTSACCSSRPTSTATARSGEPQRLKIETRWSQFTSECQRFGHPLRLNNRPL